MSDAPSGHGAWLSLGEDNNLQPTAIIAFLSFCDQSQEALKTSLRLHRRDLNQDLKLIEERWSTAKEDVQVC